MNIISDFIDRLEKIFQFDKNTTIKLSSIFNKYSNNEKYTIISNTKEWIDQLIVIDEELQLLVKQGILKKYNNNIITEWTAMNTELSKLQILSLLTKKANCDDVIKGLTDILQKKIEKVNEILEENLNDQSGGTNSNDIYIYKYTKYKNKYISLKQKLNNNY